MRAENSMPLDKVEENKKLEELNKLGNESTLALNPSKKPENNESKQNILEEKNFQTLIFNPKIQNEKYIKQFNFLSREFKSALNDLATQDKPFPSKKIIFCDENGKKFHKL